MKTAIEQMSNKSSVEWVIENLNTIYAAFYFKHIDSETFNRAYKEIIERGEAMHKEEIKDAELRGKEIIIIKHTEHEGDKK
jgi:hypothetical protein